MDSLPEELIVKIFKHIGHFSALESFQRLAMVNSQFLRISFDHKLSLYKVCGFCYSKTEIEKRNHFACAKLLNYRPSSETNISLYLWLINKRKIPIFKNHLKCLMYVKDNGLKTIYVRNATARYENLDCLKYAHENECFWGGYICDKIAEGGHLDCLKYVRENGCRWDSWTCGYAAGGGWLDCLKYARENGCRWDEFTCESAARGGHLDCLRYAHENGCAWDYRTIVAARRNNHGDCLNYALENGCPKN